MTPLTSLENAETVREAVLAVASLLGDAGIEDARLEAEVLLAHVLDTDRTDLLARFPDRPDPAALGRLAPLVERRLQREPLAYVVGYREFYGLRIDVRPGVLIPRQETETLVERAASLVHERFAGAPIIADVGCGSGAIAVALAVALPHARVLATDSSATALAVTGENARRHGVEERVMVLGGDLLAPLEHSVDVVVANLPYVRSDAIDGLQPEVRHEPPEALDGGPAGLDAIRRLLEQAPGVLRAGGAVLLECDPEQMQAVRRKGLECFPEAEVRFIEDLTGRQRVVQILTLPPSPRRAAGSGPTT